MKKKKRQIRITGAISRIYAGSMEGDTKRFTFVGPTSRVTVHLTAENMATVANEIYFAIDQLKRNAESFNKKRGSQIGALNYALTRSSG